MDDKKINYSSLQLLFFSHNNLYPGGNTQVTVNIVFDACRKGHLPLPLAVEEMVYHSGSLLTATFQHFATPLQSYEVNELALVYRKAYLSSFFLVSDSPAP